MITPPTAGQPAPLPPSTTATNGQGAFTPDLEEILAALALVFADEGPYDRTRTRAAFTAHNTLALYLRTCLRDAQPAAIPDLDTLTHALLALHISTTAIRTGLLGVLGAVDRRQLPADPEELPITQIAEMRAAISRGCDALATATQALACAYQAAAGTHT
jgi:hypothetical protein